MIVRIIDADIHGGSLSVYQHGHRTTVFYCTIDDSRMKTGAYRTFWHDDMVPAAPAAGELCPVVAARMLWEMASGDGDVDYSGAAIKEVGEHLGFNEGRGPFARAATYFLTWEANFTE